MIQTEYTSVYAQDTLTVGNLTANVGLRYDKQGGKNLLVGRGGQPGLPRAPAGGHLRGGDTASSGRRSLRASASPTRSAPSARPCCAASYSRFADQLGAGYAVVAQPAGRAARTTTTTTSLNGGRLDPISTTCADSAGASGNINPLTGGSLQSNAVDPDLDAPITDELLLSASSTPCGRSSWSA